MSWPLITDFVPMLAQPNVAFSQERLKNCVVETNSLGLPIPRSGQFASVFKAYTDQGSGAPVAIRIFTRAANERRERYDMVARHLETVSVSGIVNFSYLAKGIRSRRDGRMYPLVIMDWIEGPNLFDWVAEKCRLRDSDSLLELADQWLALVSELEAAGIVHGDLQHANVIVSEGNRLRLVDYDCLGVPALVGRVNIELGVSPYQHPQRNDYTKLDRQLSRFSELFIYVALRSLSANPTLWDEFVDQQRYDKLLFRSHDIQQPERSPLCNRITTGADPTASHLLDRLVAAAAAPYDQTPCVSSLVGELSAASDPLRAWLNIEVEQPTYYDLLDIAVDEWDWNAIQRAAERRFSQVIAACNSASGEQAKEIVSAINNAQLTLLNPELRAEYDQQIWGEEWTTDISELQPSPSAHQSICPKCSVALNLPAGVRFTQLRCPSCRQVIGVC